jgi:hypothetical protein
MTVRRTVIGISVVASVVHTKVDTDYEYDKDPNENNRYCWCYGRNAPTNYQHAQHVDSDYLGAQLVA